MSADSPNQQCSLPPRPGARRRLVRVCVLLFLLIVGWFGWAWARQAAAPVVSVAEDGSVQVNGRPLVIGPDGLPPAVLAEADGAPPVEEVDATDFPEGWVEAEEQWRAWRYPRSGVWLGIARRVRDGAVHYEGTLAFEGEVPWTLDFCGKRRWLGQPGLLDAWRPLDTQGMSKTATCTHTCWSMEAGKTRLEMPVGMHFPLERLGIDWFYKPCILGTYLVLPEGAAAARVDDRAAALEASGGKDINAGW